MRGKEEEEEDGSKDRGSEGRKRRRRRRRRKMRGRFVGSWLASDDIGPTRRIGLLVCTVSITGNALARLLTCIPSQSSSADHIMSAQTWNVLFLWNTFILGLDRNHLMGGGTARLSMRLQLFFPFGFPFFSFLFIRSCSGYLPIFSLPRLPRFSGLGSVHS